MNAKPNADRPSPVPDRASALVDRHGRPARTAASQACPQCGRGPEKRVASSGFGREPYPICVGCGFEFVDEIWQGDV